MTNEVLSTATAELIYQISAIVISTVTTMVGVYLKNLIKTNKYVKEYNLYNEKVERTLDNAIMYAEAKAKQYTKVKINKRELALKYLDRIDPEIIAKHGSKLELMLDRKVEQRFGKYKHN